MVSDNLSLCDEIQAGRLKYYIQSWKTITEDPEILETVAGLKLDFPEGPPSSSTNYSIGFSKVEENAIDDETKKLLAKQVIVKCLHEEGEYMSPIFVRPKHDGTYRLMLNLKNLNNTMPYVHFKMGTLQSILNLITPNCYLASIDLKSAYYAVPIHPDYTKYLKFFWKGQLYKFLVLPNGLCSEPRKFIKLMKPPIATLKVAGHIIAIYIDDLINVGLTYKECLDNIEASINLLQSLGFVIHFHKSILTPSKNITFLGFQINSDSMTVKLTGEKKVTLLQSCKDLLECRAGTIRHIAKVLGLITSSLPGVKYGGAHYRRLEYDKIIALRKHHGSFDAKMTISTEAVYGLKWWCKNIPTSYNDISKTTPRLTVKTDACLTGWGAVFNGAKTGGQFTQREQSMQINSSELLAAKFGLKTFIKTHNVHVKLLSDNSTTVHGINRMGSSKSVSCNAIICEIWEWAEKHNIWITTAHIPGKQNVEVDKESIRKNEKDKEWMLNRRFSKK